MAPSNVVRRIGRGGGTTGAVAALGVAAVLAAGCGGGSSAPSKSSYAKQANSICDTFNGKLDSIANTLNNNTDRSVAEQSLTQVATLTSQGLVKLKALKQPSGESQQINAAFTALQNGINDINNLVTAIKSNDRSAEESAGNKLDSDGTTINKDFDNLGIKDCGSNA